MESQLILEKQKLENKNERDRLNNRIRELEANNNRAVAVGNIELEKLRLEKNTELELKKLELEKLKIMEKILSHSKANQSVEQADNEASEENRPSGQLLMI